MEPHTRMSLVGAPIEPHYAFLPMEMVLNYVMIIVGMQGFVPVSVYRREHVFVVNCSITFGSRREAYEAARADFFEMEPMHHKKESHYHWHGHKEAEFWIFRINYHYYY